MQDNLPEYNADEQGLDQDIIEVALTTRERNARLAKYNGNRKALTDKLNSTRSLDGVFKPAKPLADSNFAVIYLRVSSEEQAKVGGTAEGYSIPYQRDACLAKAASMGLVVIDEYVDAGQSAKSANRPRLKKMLAELKAKKVRYVIVHKIDRLARNKRDDFLINEAIAEAGAALVSVVDLVDDTPQGKFNYTIQAGLAQLYVDNLAVEVMKGLSKKVEAGGTPYRAPVGYLNKRRFEGVADIRWVEIDPERAPLITWAFEQYATGDWSISQLREALTDQGFTTRPTRRQPGRTLSANGLHKILTNPYYTGIVPYQGVYHEGTHPAIVEMETWLRVQDVLTAHNYSGDKERQHPHYLKGSIFCGECGCRLIFSRNKGRGGTYDYFVCIGRHRKRTACLRKAILVSAVEAGVVDFYRTFQVPASDVASIQATIHTELATEREHAAFTVSQAKKRLGDARGQREKLLQAHYAGAVPVDMLKSEMHRFMREIASAEQELAAAQASVADLEGQLARALTVAGSCARHYASATPAVRRLMNQGFFTRLYIDSDGSVGRADFTEPFAHLLDRLGGGDDANDVRGGAAPGNDTASTAPSSATQQNAAGRGGIKLKMTVTWPVRAPEQQRTPLRPEVGRGVNIDGVAEAEGFEPPVPLGTLAFKASAIVRSANHPRC